MKEYRHNTGTFIGKGGIEIFFQSWTTPNPRGVVVIAHGLGEHSGRYENLIKLMSGKGVSFYALDHRGHGRSGGRKGHVDSWMDFIYDLKLYVNFVKDDNRKIPMILLGHSMGGLIACKYALTYPDDMDALILSSGAFIFAVKLPAWKESLARSISKYVPTLAMSNGLNPADLSHERETVVTYMSDPLVHDKATARLYTEFLNASQDCLARAKELTMPMLVFHGRSDKIVDYKGSERIFETASTARRDKSLYIFPNLFHETMNEAEGDRNRVLDIVSRWIMEKIRGAAKRAPAKRKSSAGKRQTAGKAVPKRKAAAKKRIAKKSPVKKASRKTTGKRKTAKR